MPGRREARRRRQRSPRGCCSPSFICGCSRYLASFLPKLPHSRLPRGNPRLSYTIASEDKDETPSNTAGHIVLLLSLVVACLLCRCVPFLYLDSTSTATRPGRFGWFHPNWSSPSSVSVYHCVTMRLIATATLLAAISGSGYADGSSSVSAASSEIAAIRSFFYAGGGYADDGAGGHIFREQMYVERLQPAKGITQPNPIVFIHGQAQTGTVSSFTFIFPHMIYISLHACL